MLSIIKSMSLHGLDGNEVKVEVDVSRRASRVANSRTS